MVLNPAPARELPRDLLARVDVLTPNLIELQQLSGRDDLDTVERIAAAARNLHSVEAVVVTLGQKGAIIIDRQHVHHVPGERVNALDSTGAGDAFCGALASAIATGQALGTAVRSANRFATMSTTRPGALSPTSSRQH